MPDTPASPVHAAAPARHRGGRQHGSLLRLSIAWWRPAVLAAAILTAVILLATSDVRALLSVIHVFVDDLGIWGPVVFLAIFIVWVVLALPGTWLSAMAGVLWGTLVGFGVAMAGATLGAAVCFLVARYFAREPFARFAARSRRLGRRGGIHWLEQMTREHGAIVVIVVRLVPLFPYNIMNYAFGLTAVGFWTYLFWSFICMIPGTLFVVAGSDVVARAITEGHAPPALIAIVVISLTILVVLIVLARWQLRIRESARPRA